MRLTNKEKETILKSAMRYFGNTVKVYLFGSRLDDQKRGGDIDLFVISEFRGTKLQEAKLRMITDVQGSSRNILRRAIGCLGPPAEK